VSLNISDSSEYIKYQFGGCGSKYLGRGYLQQFLIDLTYTYTCD
jgi:hypothetical protein